jgi:hypothetical protein
VSAGVLPITGKGNDGFLPRESIRRQRGTEIDFKKTAEARKIPKGRYFLDACAMLRIDKEN